MSPDASPDAPRYAKALQAESKATAMFMITVDEGWRSWILCTDMYEWAADQLLEVLAASGTRWRQP